MYSVFDNQSLRHILIQKCPHKHAKMIFLAPKYNVQLYLKFSQSLSPPIGKKKKKFKLLGPMFKNLRELAPTHLFRLISLQASKYVISQAASTCTHSVCCLAHLHLLSTWLITSL